MTPSSRLHDLDLSPIRKFSENAPAGHIPLAIGEPTWELPTEAKEALHAFEGVCRYGPGNGTDELREAIASFYDVSSEHVMISCGSQGALFSLLQAWIDPGDVVLIPNPGFVTYKNLIRFCGGAPSEYRLSADEGFRLNKATVLNALSQTGVKALIVNHPANPTGAGARPEDLAEIAEECARRDILLISDEVYRHLYLGTPPPGLREVAGTGILVSSVSKAWGGPGLRVGWAIGNAEWLKPARLVHAFAVTSASYVSQIAATALLKESRAIHIEARKQLQLRWESLSCALVKHMQLEPAVPDGAFYYWLRLPDSARRNPLEFCTKLRDEAKVLVVPGEVFGSAGREYVRLSFAAQPAQITEGIRRLAPYWLS